MVLGAEDIAMNKTHKSHALMELTFQWEGAEKKQIYIQIVLSALKKDMEGDRVCQGVAILEMFIHQV